jgi:PAS domain S-box-containing protein
MRIKTRFIMTLLLFGILLAAISGSIIFSELQAAQASEQASIARDVSHGANELSYLASNYLIYRESQQLDRWQSKVASFSSDVAKLRAEISEQEALVLNIQNNTRKYKDTFENVVSSLGNPSGNQSGTIAQTSLQVSWSRMAVQSQDLVSNASQLLRMYTIQEKQWQWISTIVIAILIGIFLAYFLINYLIVQRRTLNSIARLQAGTAVIGSGNLDFKIAEQTNDEVGDLSRAFNRMTTNLKTVTASKTDLELVNKDLEKEIYERKRAEEALARAKDELETKVKERTQELAESEEKYRLLVDNASEVIVVAQDGLIKLANRKGLKLTGYCQEEIFNKPILEIVHPDDRESVEKLYWGSIAGEAVLPNYELRIVLKDGNTRWVQANVAKISWEEKPALMALLTDISDRKMMEQDLKTYARRITEVQEEERKRIAYELHDDTAQYLSILKMQLGALAQSGKIQDPGVAEKLQFLERDADRAFSDVRRYSHELRPVVLEHQGLVAALEQIADDFNKLGEISVNVNILGIEPELSEEVKLGFFRIAQEALNNIRKHTKANQATIILAFRETHLKMMVSDNGSGFDIKEAAARAGGKGSLGLLSMRERAGLIGADLKIESEIGKGTVVTLEAPQ